MQQHKNWIETNRALFNSCNSEINNTQMEWCQCFYWNMAKINLTQLEVYGNVVYRWTKQQYNNLNLKLELKLRGNTIAEGNRDIEITVSLTYLMNSLAGSWIDCETNSMLTLFTNSIVADAAALTTFSI